MEQVLRLAGAESHVLVVAAADRLAAADVLGPGRTGEGDVGPPGERVGLGGRQRGPGAGQAGGGPGAEVAVAVGADAFDDQQVGAGPVDLVDVVGFEHVVNVGVRGGDDGVAAIAVAVGEVRQRGGGAVDPSVVGGGEQVAVRGIADHPHVDPAAAVLLDDRRLGGVEVLRRAPPGRVGDVGVGGVPGVVAGLIDQVPEFLRGEVEDHRRGLVPGADRGLVEVVRGGGQA